MLDKNEVIINVLKDYVRVVDGNGVSKVEFFDEYGVKLVVNKDKLTDTEWEAFVNTFRVF